MAPENFLDIYDPKKQNDLTEDQIAGLRDLTTEQIGQLADRYPNSPLGNYLVMEDSRAGAKQLHPLGTWQNLFALRSPQKLNQEYWIPISFKTKFRATPTAKTAPTQDLTKNEITGAEGLKTMAPVQNLGDGVKTTPVVNLDARVVTQEDLDANPGLATTGIKIGDAWQPGFDPNYIAPDPQLSDEEKALQDAAKSKAAKTANGGKK